MMDNANRHPINRYWVLRVLARSYPMPVDIHVLRRTLSDLGFPLPLTDLNSYVAYLKEKGLVAVTEREEFNLRMIAATADGLDAVDGRIPAPGISRE